MGSGETPGEIISIVYKPKGQPNRDDAYVRVPVESARLVEGYGIEGDRKGGSPKRQLNIMAHEMVQQLAAEGFSAAPGELGEQIIISGVALDGLKAGAQIRIGGAVVEVTSQRTGCGKFERYQHKSPTLAKQRMGVMARVVSSGDIRVGDPVALLQPEQAE